ncbi:MAG: hypothetical protein F6K28_25005 [Microcoleus sp. SIO2G3]|nr:hypothetical protein [Microcoleus sp. SIO2G3]
MSLHLSHSTPCPESASRRGWQSAGMSVEFLFEGRYGSSAQRTEKIEDQFNKDARNLGAFDGQIDKRSGRYRHKIALPT